MIKQTRIIATMIVLLLFAAGAWVFLPSSDAPEEKSTTSAPQYKSNSSTDTATVLENTNTALPADIAHPTQEFLQRITNKFFGTYVTPQNSPVQPEQFTGYHTGVDVEYTDTDADIPVYAFADGTVIRAQTVSGYGGVLVIAHTLRGEDILSLYGHMDVTTLPIVGTAVTAGQQVGILGRGYTSQTDGERHHLHFGIIKGHTVDWRGYVQTEAELSDWIDPLTYVE